ncbi:MAG: tRNA dihydrouridine synthase DusB [Myxococcota bacterium]
MSLDFAGLPRRFAIRPDYVIEPNLVLAPMEGVTDVTFRRLIREIGGCGLTFTEFIPARGLSHRSARELLLAQFDEDERPVVIQVFGNDPAVLAEGARVAQGLGCDGVDLNMGCPSKRVCAHSGGSALMKDPALVAQIVRSMRDALTIPFTVKMRAGWDLEHQNAPELAKICQEEGAEALAVHWRTRTELYSGTRRFDTIAAVKQSVTIPVLANGDVNDVQSAHEMLVHTGVDGLMIGRGAIRDPWLFRKIGAAMRGEPAPVIDELEKKRVLLAYFAAIRDRFRNDKGALGRFKKIAKYFVDGVRGGAELKQLVLRSQSAEQAIALIEAHFEEASSAA